MQISEAHHTNSYVEASEGKSDKNQSTRQDGMGRIVGAACCPEKVGSSGRALHGSSEGLVLLGVDHTGRTVVRCPRAFLRLAVRGPYIVSYVRPVVLCRQLI